MSEEIINIRLSKAAKEFNVGTSTIVEFLAKKGFNIDPSPNSKLTAEQYALVVKEYQGEKEVKKNADQLGNLTFKGKTITVETTEKPNTVEEEEAHTISIKTTIIHEKEEIETPQKAAPNVKKPAEPKHEPVKPSEEKQQPKEEKKEQPVIETTSEPVNTQPVEKNEAPTTPTIEPEKEEIVDVAEEKKTDEHIKINVVGKIDLPETKKAKENKGNGQPVNNGKKEDSNQQPKQPQTVKPNIAAQNNKKEKQEQTVPTVKPAKPES